MVLIGLLAFFAFSSFTCLTVAPRAEAGTVHFDPESPAGKEYALPLSQARNEALGGADEEGGVAAGSGGGAPLFGVGIGRGGAGPQGGVGTPGLTQRDRSAHNVGALRAAERGALGSTHDYPVTRFILLLGAVLLFGIALGLSLRLLHREPAQPT